MDIKKKRKKVIYVTVVTGLGIPLIALLFAMIEIFFFNFNKTQVTFSDIIFYSSSYLSQEITQMIFAPKESSLLLMLPLFVFCQCTIYAFLGWIIARLVYPNKKALPEPPATQ